MLCNTDEDSYTIGKHVQTFTSFEIWILWLNKIHRNRALFVNYITERDKSCVNSGRRNIYTKSTEQCTKMNYTTDMIKQATLKWSLVRQQKKCLTTKHTTCIYKKNKSSNQLDSNAMFGLFWWKWGLRFKENVFSSGNMCVESRLRVYNLFTRHGREIMKITDQKANIK